MKLAFKQKKNMETSWQRADVLEMSFERKTLQKGPEAALQDVFFFFSDLFKNQHPWQDLTRKHTKINMFMLIDAYWILLDEVWVEILYVIMCRMLRMPLPNLA